MVGIATPTQVDPATTTLGLAMGSTTGREIFKWKGIEYVNKLYKVNI